MPAARWQDKIWPMRRRPACQPPHSGPHGEFDSMPQSFVNQVVHSKLAADRKKVMIDDRGLNF
jgi:hypothetical protein